jgi:branched-subunit amino acid transport protein
MTPLRASEHGERWWPVALAVIVAAGLHVALPGKYRLDLAWAVPAVLLALLAALVIGDPGRIDREKTWLRIVTGVVIAFITVANLLAAVHLVQDIITSNKLFASNATGMLAAGGVIWATNVIRTSSRTLCRPSADDRRDVPPVPGLTGKAL